VTYTDKKGFQYQAWITGVTRPTTFDYNNFPMIAPPGTSYVRVAMGLKNLQTDRTAPVPTSGSNSSPGYSLPFMMHIPAAPGGSGCKGYSGSPAGGAFFVTEPGPGIAGCLAGMWAPTLAPNNYPWPPIPPGGSITVEWQVQPIATGAPLSDFELVPSLGVTSSGSLSLQP
jgi:hypothetical protein